MQYCSIKLLTSQILGAKLLKGSVIKNGDPDIKLLSCCFKLNIYESRKTIQMAIFSSRFFSVVCEMIFSRCFEFYRNLEEMMRERGLRVAHTII